MRQWVLSLPIPLRLLLAAQPKLVKPVAALVPRPRLHLQIGKDPGPQAGRTHQSTFALPGCGASLLGAARRGTQGPSFKWQAEKWPGVTSRSAGRWLAQRAIARGQRGWKWQPGGGSSGDGISPLTGMNTRLPTFNWGSDASSAWVYGWLAPEKITSDAADSTTRPRYMMTTRSDRWRTTPRSWHPAARMGSGRAPPAPRRRCRAPACAG